MPLGFRRDLQDVAVSEKKRLDLVQDRIHSTPTIDESLDS